MRNKLTFLILVCGALCLTAATKQKAPAFKPAAVSATRLTGLPGNGVVIIQETMQREISAAVFGQAQTQLIYTGLTPGNKYALQFTSQLTPGQWNHHGYFVPNSGTESYIQTVPHTEEPAVFFAFRLIDLTLSGLE